MYISFKSILRVPHIVENNRKVLSMIGVLTPSIIVFREDFKERINNQLEKLITPSKELQKGLSKIKELN